MSSGRRRKAEQREERVRQSLAAREHLGNTEWEVDPGNPTAADAATLAGGHVGRRRRAPEPGSTEYLANEGVMMGAGATFERLDGRAVARATFAHVAKVTESGLVSDTGLTTAAELTAKLMAANSLIMDQQRYMNRQEQKEAALLGALSESFDASAAWAQEADRLAEELADWKVMAIKAGAQLVACAALVQASRTIALIQDQQMAELREEVRRLRGEVDQLDYALGRAQLADQQQAAALVAQGSSFEHAAERTGLTVAEVEEAVDEPVSSPGYPTGAPGERYEPHAYDDRPLTDWEAALLAE